MNKHLKRLLLFLTTLFFIFISLFLCEQLLKSKKTFNNGEQSIFNLNKDKIFRIDNRLIFTINDDKNYRNPLKVKDSTKTNIAFVGDSVTWGVGVAPNYTYPISFEKIFNQNTSGKKVLVNNFAIPAYNLDQEYLLIKEKILPYYQPDIIVWNLNINDFWESNYSCLFAPQGHQWIRISARKNIYYWYGAIKTYFPKFITDSSTFNFIWQSFTNKLMPTNTNGNSFTFTCSTIMVDSQSRKIMIDKLNYFIKDLQNEFQKRGTKLIITLVPFQQFLDQEIPAQEIAPEYSLITQYLDNNKTKLSSINFNDSLPVPKNNLNPAIEYFLDSSIDKAPWGWRHPNQKTYEIMALSLKDYINKHSILTP